MPNARCVREVPFGTTTLSKGATIMLENPTYDIVMVGITQPVLDTWCRECEKFGHTDAHARWLTPVKLDDDSM